MLALVATGKHGGGGGDGLQQTLCKGMGCSELGERRCLPDEDERFMHSRQPAQEHPFGQNRV